MLSSRIPPDVTVREGLRAYLAENGFTTDSYSAPTVTVDVPFGRKLTFPNTANRKKAIPLHDLHHVATGYGTDLIGEAEIGAWELIGGCNTLVLFWLNGSAALLGLLLAPRRVLRALRRAIHQRTLYRDPATYERLLDLTVEQLRGRLGIPRDGQADAPAHLHASAPRPQPTGAATR